MARAMAAMMLYRQFLFLCLVIILFHFHLEGFTCCAKLWSVCTLHLACASLVGTFPIDVIFCFHHMCSLSEHIEIVVGGIVLSRYVIAPLIGAQLFDRLHTCGSTVDYFDKVIVSIGLDGDTHCHAVAHM